MKQASDILQIMLSDGSWVGYVCWVLAVLVMAQAIKVVLAPLALFKYLWAVRWSILLRPGKWSMVKVCALALVLWVFRSPLTDRIQYLEQRYINPAFTIGDTSTHTMALYELELARRVDPYELEIVKRRTRQIAARVGSTPLAIYEVAYAECGLNPFEVRSDGVAAGWIQFTNAGLDGLTIGGEQATLSQVKAACKVRDVGLIMDLTEQYLVSRAKGASLPRSVDVYVCVFAPGHIGRPDTKVLYAGWNNPSYYMNAGLDGYYTKLIDGRQHIFRSRSACDGQITIDDLNLALQAKKSRLIQKYNSFTSQSNL